MRLVPCTIMYELVKQFYLICCPQIQGFVMSSTLQIKSWTNGFFFFSVENDRFSSIEYCLQHLWVARANPDDPFWLSCTMLAWYLLRNHSSYSKVSLVQRETHSKGIIKDNCTTILLEITDKYNTKYKKRCPGMSLGLAVSLIYDILITKFLTDLD